MWRSYCSEGGRTEIRARGKIGRRAQRERLPFVVQANLLCTRTRAKKVVACLTVVSLHWLSAALSLRDIVLNVVTRLYTLRLNAYISRCMWFYRWLLWWSMCCWYVKYVERRTTFSHFKSTQRIPNRFAGTGRGTFGKYVELATISHFSNMATASMWSPNAHGWENVPLTITRRYLKSVTRQKQSSLQ